MVDNNTYSLDFWKNYDWGTVIIQPSDFAKFCLSYLKPGGHLLDVCSGNGRDSIFFENNKINVSSFDFEDLDLREKKYKFSTDVLFDYVYCRFVLHAVLEDLEDYILINANNVLKQGGLLFIEVRSDKGVVSDNIDQHYRRLINKEEVKKKLINLNFDILVEEESNRFSANEKEDPVLIRLVAKKASVMKVKKSFDFDSWHNPAKKIDLKSCAYLLLKVKTILEAYNIPFLLVFGTLLGAYRDKGFIPHDKDIDIGILEKHKEKILDIISGGYFSLYGIELIRNAGCLYSLKYKEDYIDLYFFTKKKKAYTCSKYNIDAFQIEKKLSKIMFLGEEFDTVHNIERYLIRHYGKTWRNPIENKHARF